ncbi:MAG: MATE family efflux transporter [Lachnospiraceae bacterium]|nr:MATE family efflux transporter [Lachnospiraceae bacterium]
MASTKNYQVDMLNGPLVGKMIIFTIPLILSSLLQLLFNAADMVVVGRWAGSNALGAVGSTGALINLLVNLFVGLAVGANVLTAHFYGAGAEKDVSETVHTGILMGLFGGILVGLIGILAARPLLTLMSTPEDVIDLAVLYMQIYFAGMPFSLLYNFGSSMLRAVGDTRRPLYYLTVAGIVNVILNLIFVIGFNMSVAGVALATVISQGVSVALLLQALMREEGCIRLSLSKLSIKKDKMLQMMRIGIPAGLQGMVFSFSNVLIQSSVNSFGSAAVAGNSAASNLEGFIYVAMNAFSQTSLCFTGQNYGARKFHRINPILRNCLIMVGIVGFGMGAMFYTFAHQLLGIYSTDPNVISYGILRMSVICLSYFLCGMMDTMVGQLRGLGYAVMPMIVSMLGACGLRILWILTVFRMYRSLTTLYISYPVSWGITVLTHMICYVIVFRKVKKREMAGTAA